MNTEPNTSSGERASQDGDALRSMASRETASARDEANRLRETVTDGTSRLAAGAREKVYESAETGKDYAAGSLKDFTAAIRKASDELGERDQSAVAGLVREAASGLEQVSGAIEGKSVSELTGSVASFARRQPAAFLIGAALAGVALGRFARASAGNDTGRRPAQEGLGARTSSYSADHHHRQATTGDREEAGHVSYREGYRPTEAGAGRERGSAADMSSTTGLAGSSRSGSGTEDAKPGGSAYASTPPIPAGRTIGETVTPGATSNPTSTKKDGDHER